MICWEVSLRRMAQFLMEPGLTAEGVTSLIILSVTQRACLESLLSEGG